MKSGPIAALPLSQNKSSLVWTVPKSWAKDMTKLTPDEFAIKLNNALQVNSTNAAVEAINVAFGSFLRPFRVDQRVTGPVKPPHISRVDNLAAFPLGLGMPERS